MDLNTLLNARFNKGARSLFGLEEQEGITTVSPELQLVAILEGPNLEYRFNTNELIFGRSFVVPADVGNPTGFQLRNPLASGVLAIIEYVEVSVDLATVVTGGVLGDPVVDLGTVAQAVVRDTRALVSRLSTSVASFGPGAFGGSGQIRRRLGAAGAAEWTHGWVLRPGDAFQLATVSNNIAVDGSIAWRERPHRPSELAG